jgi:serine/threonine protein kinase
VVRKSHTRRKNNLERIKTERQVLATAEHPFVVSLYYSFQSAKNLYMVMEFVNGGDLYSLLQNVGYLEEDVTCLYVAEIGLALHYLHNTLGVVHRDIKPENVLIHQDGHIKLTDFGLSVFGLSEWPTDRPSDQDYHTGGSGTPSMGASVPSSLPPSTPASMPSSEPASVPGSGVLSGFSSLRVPDAGGVHSRRRQTGSPDHIRIAASSDPPRPSPDGSGGAVSGRSRPRGMVASPSIGSMDDSTSNSVPEDSVPASPKGNTASKANTPISSPRPLPALSRAASPRLGTSANPMRPPPAVPAQKAEMRATVGTPDYMAPELLLSQYHGKGVDLWALGCLTFELLTGYTPFTAGTVAEVFENILEHTTAESIRWPGEEGHLSPHAVALIRELLHPLPERRLGFDSIDELCNHPFFDDNGIDWELLLERQVAVPFVPAPEASDDVSYFVPKPQPASGNATRGGSPRSSHDLSDDADGFDPATGLPTPAPSPLPRRHANDVPMGDGARVPEEEGAEDPDFIPNFAYENLNALLAKNMEQTERASGVQGASLVTSPMATTREGKEPDLQAEFGRAGVVFESTAELSEHWKKEEEEEEEGEEQAAAPTDAAAPAPAAEGGSSVPSSSSAAGSGGGAAAHGQESSGSAAVGGDDGGAPGDGRLSHAGRLAGGGHVPEHGPGRVPTPQAVLAYGSARGCEPSGAARSFLPMDGVVDWEDPGRNDSPASCRPSSRTGAESHSPAAATAPMPRRSSRSARSSPRSLSPRSLPRSAALASPTNGSPMGHPRVPGPLSPYRSPNSRTPAPTPPHSRDTSPSCLRRADTPFPPAMSHPPLEQHLAPDNSVTLHRDSSAASSQCSSQRTSPRVSPRMLRPHPSSPLSAPPMPDPPPSSARPAATDGHAAARQHARPRSSSLRPHEEPPPPR